MTQFQLNKEGDHARKLTGDESTAEWHNVLTSAEYLRWLEEGNEPLPADEPEAAEQPAED